jgi:hypothetical protein
MGRGGSVFAAELSGLAQRNGVIFRRYWAGEDFAGMGASLDLTRERVRRGSTSAPSKIAPGQSRDRLSKLRRPKGHEGKA